MNVEKLDTQSWELVTETFATLFEKTTAYGLFDDRQELVDKLHRLRSSSTNEGGGELNDQDGPSGASVVVEISEERHRNFQQVITKSILQLLLIQTVNELLSKDAVYFAYPAKHLMELMGCLGRSFHFAKHFNEDNDLRVALCRFGKLYEAEECKKNSV